jgi:hypothetical protein
MDDICVDPGSSAVSLASLPAVKKSFLARKGFAGKHYESLRMVNSANRSAGVFLLSSNTGDPRSDD